MRWLDIPNTLETFGLVRVWLKKLYDVEKIQ